MESKENKNKKKESLHDIQNSNPIIINTLLPTTAVNVEKMNLEEFCKSYKKYFIHNNLENVINNLKDNFTSKYNTRRKTRNQIQKDW